MPLIYYTESHSLHFVRLEFALITGLPFGTVNFGLYTSGELKFHNRVFPHKLGLSVTKLDVIGVIEDEETFKKLCDQDFIRLCLILALEVIFMGWFLTCPVDDTLFRLVKNLEDWNCFPWGEHIWTHLYDEIKNVIEKHIDEHYFGMKKDHMYVPTYTLSGFVFAFQHQQRMNGHHYQCGLTSNLVQVICLVNNRTKPIWKEIMYEFSGPSPTKESQVSVTNYKRAIVNGKAKMVEVEDVGLVHPVGSETKVQRSTAKVCQLTCSSL
ncbi:hypothetical protein Tco_0879288 [Tanacetum coccineum]